jgi:hypothetical protein
VVVSSNTFDRFIRRVYPAVVDGPNAVATSDRITHACAVHGVELYHDLGSAVRQLDAALKIVAYETRLPDSPVTLAWMVYPFDLTATWWSAPSNGNKIGRSAPMEKVVADPGELLDWLELDLLTLRAR